MSDKIMEVVGGKKNKDLVLQLFILYVTPLCVYLQSLFFATTNAWAAIYIAMIAGMMLTNRRFSVQVKSTDSLFFVFMLIACFSSIRAGEYLYFMQAFLVLLFVWGYTKYDIGSLYRYLDVIVYFGIACATACIIQELWNGFYTGFVSKLFKSQEVETILRLEENMGNCGLMSQTSHSAACILNAFLILMFKNNPKNKKIVWGIILFLGLLLTGKRAHLFMGALVFFLSFFVGYEGKKEGNAIVKGSILAVALVCVLFIVMPFLPADNTIAKGVNTIVNFDLDDEDIMHGRELLYAEAILMGESSPLTGHGWGSFKKTVSYRGGNTDAHNIYLQLFAEEGVIVLAVFIISAIVLTYSSIQLLKKLRRKYPEHSVEVTLTKLAFCFLLFFYLYGLTGNGLYNIDFLIVLGLGVSIIKRVKQVTNV